jgi:uncharacterized tellurite resistance protein B-like protein
MGKTMKDDKAEKKAAQQALYEFRHEHAKADLELARKTLLDIIQNDGETSKAKTDASRELIKMHGGHTPTEKPAQQEKAKEKKEQEWELPPDMQIKIDEIINGSNPTSVS